MEHDGNMLMADQRTKMYEDRSKVIAKMADAFYIFSRSIFFNPEMAEQYNHSHDKYINYFTQIGQNIDIFLQEDQLICTKTGFSQVPVPGYLPSSYDLEQTDADQIIQMANEEVASTNKEMQVIMQSDNRHLHINKTGSFSRLRSFKLNNMGFSLNRISLIMFNEENQQTPVNCGTQRRAPTLMPREKKVPWNTQQEQTYDEVENINKAHHKPQGGASYNPDESVANEYVFQNVQGRFGPPNVSNMPTQPQQQQQSSSEEGSKETTILNGPRHQKEMGAQDHPLGPADSVPEGPSPTAPTHTSQTGGPPRAPPVTNQNVEGHQTCNHHQYMTQNHQDLLECNGTTRAPGNSGKGPGPTKGKSKMSEPQPWNIIRHSFHFMTYWGHLKTQY